MPVVDTYVEHTLATSLTQPSDCITRNKDRCPDSRMQRNLEGFMKGEVAKLKMYREKKGEPGRGTVCAKTQKSGPVGIAPGGQR